MRKAALEKPSPPTKVMTEEVGHSDNHHLPPERFQSCGPLWTRGGGAEEGAERQFRGKSRSSLNKVEVEVVFTDRKRDVSVRNDQDGVMG